MQKFIKKNKTIFIILLIIILITPTITLSKIVYNLVLEHYYKTQNFYFSSDLLSKNNPKYKINNWSGVDSYVITINMNSILNEKKRSESDIAYKIGYSCDEKVECYLDKNEGVIISSNEINGNQDVFTLTVVPKKTFVNNEETVINISTTSTSPYKKKIGAEFTLSASKIGLSYEITDKSNDIFSVLRLTNSLTYYTVSESFLEYNIGDEIDQDIYNSLSNENKKKCYSLGVSIKFDPKVINLDLTNPIYLKVLKNNPENISTINLRRVLKEFNTYQENDLIDENTYNNLSFSDKQNISEQYAYVNGIIFDIDAISSDDIKFYKKDKLQNYTYPIINENSIIEVR